MNSLEGNTSICSFLRVDNPKYLIHILSTLIVIFSLSACSNEIKEQKEFNSNYHLVWSDEFNYTGLPDSSKWNFIVGDGCPELCGWGNNELQYYTKNRLKNARVVNGILTIEVHKEEIENQHFSSAKLTTKEKSNWKYGRFEIRAKLPTQNGTKSGIWIMQGDSSLYSTVPQKDQLNILGVKGIKNYANKPFPVNDNDFHTYVLEWEENEYRVYADSIHYFTYPNDSEKIMNWPFNQSLNLILNVAFDGNESLTDGEDNQGLPQKMEVDYVRVYQIET